jgi:septal ring factor EnvC (AmiA/AmiB activator)
MKKVTRFALIAIILLALLLSACAPPPPPVTQNQLQNAQREAVSEEEKANQLAKEKANLEKELATKKAEVDRLEQYKRQLLAE